MPGGDTNLSNMGLLIDLIPFILLSLKGEEEDIKRGAKPLLDCP